MIYNYIKIARRNLAKHKAYSFINISGLAVGMAIALLNGLWVWDELSFDQYHQNYNRIALVMTNEIRNGQIHYNKSVSYPLANELKTNYQSYFKHILIARPEQEYVLTTGENKLSKVGQFIEAGAPDMLTLTMLKGARDALKDPHSLLLSASTAKALFGENDPMGQFVKINNTMDVAVTGVYEDLPNNTQFHNIQFFAPWELYKLSNPNVKDRSWNDNFLSLYTQIESNTDFNRVSATIKDAKLNRIASLEGMKEQITSQPQVFLLPMSDWHLYGYFKDDRVDKGPARLIWLVGLIGGFVLLLACINFMNISTARSEKRAKEVGVRKAVGSLKSQLIKQFLTESFLIVLVAFLLSLLLVTVSLSWFNEVAGKEIRMPWASAYFWLIGLCFNILTGLLAGSYPALYLSSFQPVKVLKGTFRLGRFASAPRKVLVVMQFMISVSLIISTIIVYRQILFAQDRPIGYSREGLLLIEMKSPDFKGKYEALRSELRKTGVVAEIAESSGQLTEAYLFSNAGGFSWKGKEPALETDFGTLSITPSYGKTVGWQVVDGRDFSPDLASDSAAFIINEAAAKFMGIRSPVGEIVQWAPGWQKAQNFRIIGVIKNMVMTSPYDPIQPTTYRLEGYRNWINIKINPTVSTSEALPKIEAVFKHLVPAAPFDYRFADQEYTLKFVTEQRIGTLAALFAGLAIFISCLGLFGLASFTAEQRTKEIGIRKVMGATVFNLWRLLSKDFVLLVVVAFVIAAPMTYYFLNNWLQNYQYRVSISWWIFAVAGAGAIFITLLTVSYQAIKVALLDPVKSLRSE